MTIEEQYNEAINWLRVLDLIDCQELFKTQYLGDSRSSEYWLSWRFRLTLLSLA